MGASGQKSNKDVVEPEATPEAREASVNRAALDAGQSDDAIRERTTGRVAAAPARHLARYTSAYPRVLNADNASELFPDAASKESGALCPAFEVLECFGDSEG